MSNSVKSSVKHTQSSTSVATDKTADSTQPQSRKIGLIGLLAVVMSAMVGGGIFDLPQNMAASASGAGQIIAWLITGVGMWFIANMFRILASARPELKNGLYTYAYTGFGRFIGFLVSYGYWICNCFAMVAYGVLIFSTLNYFFPGTFTGGSNLWSIIGASIINWVMLWLSLKGAKSGAILSVIGTIAKTVPVLIFIVAMISVFHAGTFTHGFWGWTATNQPAAFDWSNLMKQVSGTMVVTLWLFIGIEGASVVSGEARSQKDVARATTIGYLAVFTLYVLVSLLPLGVYGSSQIAGMSNPSMAAIMQSRFGSWGAITINIGVIVSVLSSWLVWMLMLGQMPLFAARDGLFPSAFTRLNSHHAPSSSLIWTAVVCQALFFLCFFETGNAWNTMISITSAMAMPCYLLCCLYLWKIARNKRTWGVQGHGAPSRRGALITGIIGTIFALYLVYSAGLDYLMIACVVYALGVPIFVVSRRQKRLAAGQRAQLRDLFTPWERVLLVLIIVAGIAGIIYTVYSGLFA